MASNKIKIESSTSKIFLNWSSELIPTGTYSCCLMGTKSSWRPNNIPLMKKEINKIIIEPLIKGGTATIRPITKYYLGWWEGLVPTGTYNCFLDKDGLKSWRLYDYPLIK